MYQPPTTRGQPVYAHYPSRSGCSCSVFAKLPPATQKQLNTEKAKLLVRPWPVLIDSYARMQVTRSVSDSHMEVASRRRSLRRTACAEFHRRRVRVRAHSGGAGVFGERLGEPHRGNEAGTCCWHSRPGACSGGTGSATVRQGPLVARLHQRPGQAQGAAGTPGAAVLPGLCSRGPTCQQLSDTRSSVVKEAAHTLGHLAKAPPTCTAQ